MHTRAIVWKGSLSLEQLMKHVAHFLTEPIGRAPAIFLVHGLRQLGAPIRLIPPACFEHFNSTLGVFVGWILCQTLSGRHDALTHFRRGRCQC